MFIEALDNHLRSVDDNYLPPPVGSRYPMQVMLRFHLWRALALRDRAEKEKGRFEVAAEVKGFPGAAFWCTSKYRQTRSLANAVT